MSRQCPPLYSSFLFFCLFSFAVARAAMVEPASGPNSNPAVAHPLERADLEPWLDGFMRYALERGDIPGAVVSVVKNGEVMFANIARIRARELRKLSFEQIARKSEAIPATFVPITAISVEMLVIDAVTCATIGRIAGKRDETS